MYTPIQRITLNFDENGDRKVLVVTYEEMRYDDWFTFINASSRRSDSGVAYLITRYITRSYLKTPDGEVDCPLIELMKSQPMLIAEIIDYIHSDCRYNNIEAIEQTSKELVDDENNIHTIIDAFFFYHLDIGSYMALREVDFATRMRVLTHLERKVEINVMERFREGRETGIVDIIHSNRDLALLEHEENLRRDPFARRRQNGEQEESPPAPGDNFARLMADIEKHHKSEMARQKNNPSRSFDYHSDEAAIMRADRETDEKVLNQTKR